MNTKRHLQKVWTTPHWYFSRHFMQMLYRLVTRLEEIASYVSVYIPDKYDKHERIQKVLIDAAEAIYAIVVEEQPND